MVIVRHVLQGTETLQVAPDAGGLQLVEDSDRPRPILLYLSHAQVEGKLRLVHSLKIPPGSKSVFALAQTK